MKPIYPLSIILALSASVSADGSAWRMHPTFEGEMTHVIETPEYVYFVNRVLPKDNKVIPDYMTMFRLDKEGEEIQNITTDNYLPVTSLYEVMRNSGKGYIMTLGSDYSISLLYDNGDVKDIPAYRQASITESKDVNALTPDAAHDNVYMATGFGYVVLNDKKYEIADSRNYGSPLKSVARIGDNIIILTNGALLSAPVSHPRFSLSDYKTVKQIAAPLGLYPLSESKCVLLAQMGSSSRMYILSLDAQGEVVMDQGVDGQYTYVEYNDEGLTLNSRNDVKQVNKDGSYVSIPRPEGWTGGIFATRNNRDFWFGEGGNGLLGMRYDANSGWTRTQDFIIPDAPAPFLSTCMMEHPTEGLLVSNFGNWGDNYNYAGKSPLLLSGYKDGRWNADAFRSASPQPTVIVNPFGFAVDPDNPNYIYSSSLHSGMARLNLEDPADVIHFVSPSHATGNETGYVPLIPNQPSIKDWSCSMTTPRFDSYGNLWSMHANYDFSGDKLLSVYCWEAADRKGTVSATDIRLPKLVMISGAGPAHAGDMNPLLTKRNKNLLVFWKNSGKPDLMVVDTGGTPTDTNDDRREMLVSPVDQDGNTVDVADMNVMFEDPSTGYVWVGYSGGVFYFDPHTLLEGSPRINRVKVARNDGTNLADYLLNEVDITSITADGYGNKWLGTNGAGLVCTTSDGRTILEEVTRDNSDLPSDEISLVKYIPSSNSLMISTRQGLCEYTLKSRGNAGDEEEVKVYPNPVRPEYSGYITIDGLRDGSLVKIVDGGGNIVKELGPVSGSTVEWDGTNLHFSKVSSGVYFILSSGGDSDSSFANVGKVLVVK
ncbi:MAG: T9SS type A sorting domain-containing protein [Muribaculaceae bacterium]|nr:T9SS type A sorting domain-containing protein [Muribaculaceae bacterium]